MNSIKKDSNKVSVETKQKKSFNYSDIKKNIISKSKVFIYFLAFDSIFLLISMLLSSFLSMIYDIIINNWTDVSTGVFLVSNEKIAIVSSIIYVSSLLLTLTLYFMSLFLSWKFISIKKLSMKGFFRFSLFVMFSHIYMFIIVFMLYLIELGLEKINLFMQATLGILVFIVIFFYLSVFYVYSLMEYFNKKNDKEKIISLSISSIKSSFVNIGKYGLAFSFFLVIFFVMSYLFTLLNLTGNILSLLILLVFMISYKVVYYFIYLKNSKI